MPDILHDFPVAAPAERVFDMFATPAGLDAWWTARSSGTPSLGAEYHLWFAPEYDWRARVTACDRGRRFELQMTRAMDDWMGTRVRAELDEQGGITTVRFAHLGWREAGEHFRISSFCWAMYLRLLRLHLEQGLVVEYARRLEV